MRLPPSHPEGYAAVKRPTGGALELSSDSVVTSAQATSHNLAVVSRAAAEESCWAVGREIQHSDHDLISACVPLPVR